MHLKYKENKNPVTWQRYCAHQNKNRITIYNYILVKIKLMYIATVFQIAEQFSRVVFLQEVIYSASLRLLGTLLGTGTAVKRSSMRKA